VPGGAAVIDVAASVAACHRQNHLCMTKTAEDVDRYEPIITEYRPEVIVECGTYEGWSALWFSQWSEVVTVDLCPRPSADGVLAMAVSVGRVTRLSGRSSVDPAVVAEVRDLVAGRRVLVSLDSDHSPGHVLAEMDAYSQLVHPGGWMVVEDGIVRHWLRCPGPLDAIEPWLAAHPQWVADVEVEDMHPVTLFPSGWLWRIE